MDSHLKSNPRFLSRIAGLLYLVIIIFGISSELLIRSRLIHAGDFPATAEAILNFQGLFRVGFFADSLMCLSDVVLALLLYFLLRPAGRILALAALFFRLTQTAVLALNLLNYHAAILLINGDGYSSSMGPDQVRALSSFFLDLHSHGYDLGLLLFGVHCLILGWLILKSGYFPRALGILVMAAGPVYLIGSYTRFLFPDLVTTIQPIYLITIISELSLCLWLLLRGPDRRMWERATQLPPA